jgi:hypothetical protein
MPDSEMLSRAVVRKAAGGAPADAHKQPSPRTQLTVARNAVPRTTPK